MTETLRRIGLALLLTFAAPAAFAQDEGEDAVDLDESVLSDEALIFPDAWWLPGRDEGRKDVREVSIPLPPSGPATPVPYCGPSAPVCP